jgi:hypothetical protein
LSVELISANLLSPMVLAFALGFLATLIKSDLKLPEGLYTSLSIYLLFAIGLKGGAELSVTPVSQLWAPALGTLVVSLVTAWIAYIASRKLGKLDKANAASFAAHYGSVSAVTFIAAESFATLQGLKFEGFMPALVALLEIPAFLFALAYLGRAKDGAKVGVVVRELFTGKTIVLLVGGVLIGVLTGKEGMAQVQPLFGDLFKGALTIFLLEMGLVAASRVDELKANALFIGLFATLVPLVNGLIGVVIGHYCGLSDGGAGILGAMAASASYIAAPAAVRIALPSANPSLYLTAALAVTFPFNLLVGIPLFQQVAQALG